MNPRYCLVAALCLAAGLSASKADDKAIALPDGNWILSYSTTPAAESVLRSSRSKTKAASSPRLIFPSRARISKSATSPSKALSSPSISSSEVVTNTHLKER